METNETQPQNPQDDIKLTNDELAAAMGYMTTLGDQNMQAQMQPEDEEIPDEEPTEKETPEVDTEAIKKELMKDVKSLLKEEIGGIRELLKEALKDEKESD